MTGWRAGKVLCGDVGEEGYGYGAFAFFGKGLDGEI